jgi:hypothetical protein
MRIYPDGSGGFLLRGEHGFVIPIEGLTGGSPGTVDVGLTEAEMLGQLADAQSPIATAVSALGTNREAAGHIP